MSEEDTTGDHGKSSNQNNSINRRRFVKALSVTGGVAALGSLSTLPASALPSSDQEINVKNLDPSSGPDATTAAETTVAHNKVQELTSVIQEDTGFSPNKPSSLSFDVETDNSEYNSRNPTLAAVALGEEAGANSRYSANNGGILFSILLDDNGERKPASSLAYTAQPAYSGFSSFNSQDDMIEQRMYGQTNKSADSPGLVRKTESSAIDTADRNMVRPMSPITKCDACYAVVPAACAATQYLTQSSCVGACWSVGLANPIAGGACFGLCAIIATTGFTIGCTASTPVICKGILDVC